MATATAASWQNKPFSGGKPLAYRESFSAADYALLREGLIPKVMEDRWFIYFAAPHLLFHRSWTGDPVYRVLLQETGDGAAVDEALCMPDIFERLGADYNAMTLDRLISNRLLHRNKPLPSPRIWPAGKARTSQGHALGIGYPAVAPAPRRWWQFWR